MAALTSLALCDINNKYACISFPQGTWNCNNSVYIPPGQVLQIGHTSTPSGGPANQTAAPAPSPTAGPPDNSSKNLAIGLGVGIPAVVILAGALIFFGLQYRKARQAGSRGPSEQQYTPVQYPVQQLHTGNRPHGPGPQHDYQPYGSVYTPATYKPELSGQNTVLRELGDNRPAQIHELQGQDEEQPETSGSPVRDRI